MPLLAQFQPEAGCLTGIWHCTDEVKDLLPRFTLTASDTERFNTIRNPSRQLQWLGCRAALGTLLRSPLVPVEYNADGKPLIPHSGASISFSHTDAYAAAILSYKGRTGIDMETIRPRIERVADRYLSPQELNLIPSENRRLFLSLCWSIKEAIYKLYGSPSVDLQHDITIETIDYLCGAKGNANATLRRENIIIPLTVSILRVGHFVLSWVCIPDNHPDH